MKIKQSSFYISLILSLFLTSACGGGGGGEDGGEVMQSEQGDVQDQEEEGEAEEETSEVEEEEVSVSCGTAQRPLKIMPFGDSITESERGHNSYRRRLWRSLEQAACVVDFVGRRRGVSQGSRDSAGVNPPNPDFDLDHEGRWDYRADEVVPIASSAVSSLQPDIVLLHIGSNDIFQEQSASSTAADIARVIAAMRAARPDVVILLAKVIPSASRRGDLARLNSEIEKLAVSLRDENSPLILVDHFSGYFASDNYDGIHPGPSGEAKMAGKWANAILELVFGGE